MSRNKSDPVIPCNPSPDRLLINVNGSVVVSVKTTGQCYTPNPIVRPNVKTPHTTYRLFKRKITNTASNQCIDCEYQTSCDDDFLCHYFATHSGNCSEISSTEPVQRQERSDDFKPAAVDDNNTVTQQIGGAPVVTAPYSRRTQPLTRKRQLPF